MYNENLKNLPLLFRSILVMEAPSETPPPPRQRPAAGSASPPQRLEGGGESSPDEESTGLDLLTDRLHHSLNSECESGYDESPSECDLREEDEEEEEDDDERGEEMAAAQRRRRRREEAADLETFTDEGRVSVESGGGEEVGEGEEEEELPEDSVASTTELHSQNTELNRS